MTQSNIFNPARTPDSRLSNLPVVDSKQYLVSTVNPDEEDDFSIEAIFDSYGCVSDLKAISLS